MSAANLTTMTTIAASGAETLRFTDWRAAISPTGARVAPTEAVTIIVQAIDADDVDAAECDDPHSIIIEADVPGIRGDSAPARIQSAANEALRTEGFRLVDVCWTWDGTQYVALIEPICSDDEEPK